MKTLTHTFPAACLILIACAGCTEAPTGTGSTGEDDMSASDMAMVMVDMTATPVDMTADMVAPDMTVAPADMPADMAPDMSVDMPADMPIDMAPMSACVGGCDVGEVCDEDAGECVACLGDDDCEEGKVCGPENTCVTCVSNTTCEENSPDTPLCDTVKDACVACLESPDCVGSAGGAVCDVETSQCVECISDADCASDLRCDTTSQQCVTCLDRMDCDQPDAAICDEGNTQTCIACGQDSDCDHLGLNRCVDDVCQTCTPDTEADDCGQFACDPETFTCTQTVRGDLGICEPCKADSECGMNQGCVELTFQGVTDSYCLVDGVANSGCPEPYQVPLNGAMSRSGTMSNWCGINQQLTSCVAVRERKVGAKTCATSADCGLPGVDDGLCADQGILGFRCTYQCSSGLQCDSTTEVCSNPAGDGQPVDVCSPQ